MDLFAGIGLKLLSTLIFAIMIALAKWLSHAFPVGELVFARSFFALIPIAALVVWEGGLVSALSTRNPWGHLWRGLFGCAGIFFGFLALRHLPLPDVTAIGYATPLLTTAFAVVILGEKVGVYRWSAVSVGLLGVVLMLWPHIVTAGPRGDGVSLGALYALSGACMAAMAMVHVRKLVQTERPSAIVFYAGILTSLVGLATLPAGWVMPGPAEAAALVGMGVLGGMAQIVMTLAYRRAAASLIAPFDYASMIWAVLIGYLVFAELPALLVVIGAAIVIASGIFVIWRERQLGLERRRARAARQPEQG